MNELRRAIPFLLLPLLLFAAGCQLLPPGFLAPATPMPAPVTQSTPDPSPSPSLIAVATPTPTPTDTPTDQPEAEPQGLRELRDRREAWTANEIDSYGWWILLTCYCGPRDWIDVAVENDVVEYADRQDDEPLSDLDARFVTVDQQFDEMISVARAGGDVRAAFGRFGQPIVIRLDPSPNAYDDDLTIVNERFLPAEADDAPSAESLDSLEVRIAAWEAARIDDYTWRIRFACFCDPSAPVDVRVEDGAPVTATTVSGDPIEHLHDRVLTVEDLFAEMRRTIANGGLVRAEYGAFGEPRSVTLDYAPNGDDDELHVETRRFTPAP